MRGRPETVAAIVNGLVVLLAPVALLAIGPLLFPIDRNASVTVRPPGASNIGISFMEFALLELVLIPFATLASWRTWAHARRFVEGRSRGWMGVAEAGATGLAVALVYLAPGIVTRPLEAPPYVIVYGSAALFLGLLVGLALRLTTLLVLRLHRSAAG